MSMKYTKEHEWVRVEGDTAVIGISDYAQSQLGEIVFIELPDTGKTLARGDEACVIESVKAASEVYAPASGDVSETNGDLDTDPGKVNEDATGEGWLFKLSLSDASELDDLMDEAAYKAYVEELG
ncbi:MAG: glycine cleavage system protein GcvH [Rhodospirillales bacterium]|nr:glycine cleavage system protein GcvH [Alphaproteobacteria bacterium]MBL6947657.1 glycine cleavage system protein GcvH [Rhodospirillales bacterium]